MLRFLLPFLLTARFCYAVDPPEEIRLAPLKTLDGYFPFEPPADRSAWELRSATVKRQLQIALGLHPLPARTELNPVIHGKVDCGAYTVERVIFESMPGFYVTGSLFRPGGRTGKLPVVMCPHGHWPNGRFLRQTEGEISEALRTGAEVQPAAAGAPLQARCAGLAGMGCIVFHYDMIGYADSVQLSLDLAHHFKTQRPDMNAAEGWGFFSPRAEGELHSVMGLQIWNSIRALDFVASLPDADPERIGVTGASGGGTQTFLLCALDPRPAAAFPCVMVSTAMQGGCTCENASLLRVGTGNVEIAALFAPKPLGMTAANDWTVEMSTKGYPELQRLYGLLGAPQNVFLHSRTEFPHNYNLPSRLAMYRWFATHLKTPSPAPEQEAPLRVLTTAELTVWDAAHPAPAAGDAVFERVLLKSWNEGTRKSLKQFPELIDEALPVIAGRSSGSAGTSEWVTDTVADKNGWKELSGWIANRTHHERVAAVFYFPQSWNRNVKVLLSGSAAEAAALAAKGEAVCLPVLYSEPAPGTPTKTRTASPREFAGYTLGYNSSVMQRRAHDVMTILSFIRNYKEQPAHIALKAGPDTAPEAVLALTQAPAEWCHSAHLSTGGFSFASVADIRSPRLLPGALRYGDMPEMIRRIKVADLKVE